MVQLPFNWCFFWLDWVPTIRLTKWDKLGNSFNHRSLDHAVEAVYWIVTAVCVQTAYLEPQVELLLKEYDSYLSEMLSFPDTKNIFFTLNKRIVVKYTDDYYYSKMFKW